MPIDMLSIRLATNNDVTDLEALVHQFFDESAFKDGLEYDRLRVLATLDRYILTGFCPYFLAEIGHVAGQELEHTLVGFASYSLDHTFTKTPIAILGEIYVQKKFRGSEIGRKLLGILMISAESDGATAFHAPLAAGMTEGRTLRNMFAKAGFIELGVTMRRRLDGGRHGREVEDRQFPDDHVRKRAGGAGPAEGRAAEEPHRHGDGLDQPVFFKHPQ